MYMPKNSRRDALTREQFDAALKKWYQATSDDRETIGDPKGFGGKPWTVVTAGTRYYHLNADTTRQGVAGYPATLEESNGTLLWSVRKENKVVFGKYGIAQMYFFLYSYP